jgi:hypothetical protein
MTPVRRRDLAVLALGLAVATWLLVRAAYGALPPLDWWLPVPVGVLAITEALGARTLRARLSAEREARAAAGRGQAASNMVRPVDPLLVARIAVLAQASAWVGAVFAGVWAGVLAHVGPALGRLQSAGGDTVAGILGVVCAAGLVAAALWLESACRVPPQADDDRLDAGPLA